MKRVIKRNTATIVSIYFDKNLYPHPFNQDGFTIVLMSCEWNESIISLIGILFIVTRCHEPYAILF